MRLKDINEASVQEALSVFTAQLTEQGAAVDLSALNMKELVDSLKEEHDCGSDLETVLELLQDLHDCIGSLGFIEFGINIIEAE